MEKLVTHPTKKTWVSNILIVSINGEKRIFYPIDKLNNVMRIIAPALLNDMKVEIAVLPADTRKEFVTSFDKYDYQYSIRGNIKEIIPK